MRIIHRLPSSTEYNMFRQRCGWRTYDHQIATDASANSLFCVLTEDASGSPIGMGRLVSDGHICVHVQDVLVIPEFQRMGLGRAIVDEILRWLDENVADTTNVGLLPAKVAQNFPGLSVSKTGRTRILDRV